MHHFLASYPLDTPAPGRRPDHQRPLEDRRAAQRHHRRHPDLPQGDRLVALLRQHAAMRSTSAAGASPADAREVYEEGLFIPITKLYDAGAPDEPVFELIARQRAHARGGAGRHPRAGRRQRGRRPPAAAGSWTSSVSPTSSRWPTRSSRAPSARCASGSPRCPTATTATSSEHRRLRRSRCASQVAVRVRGDELIVDYAGTSPTGRPRHQRGAQLHRRPTRPTA